LAQATRHQSRPARLDDEEDETRLHHRTVGKYNSCCPICRQQIGQTTTNMHCYCARTQVTRQTRRINYRYILVLYLTGLRDLRVLRIAYTKATRLRQDRSYHGYNDGSIVDQGGRVIPLCQRGTTIKYGLVRVLNDVQHLSISRVCPAWLRMVDVLGPVVSTISVRVGGVPRRRAMLMKRTTVTRVFAA
jgi:hypothetical protein